MAFELPDLPYPLDALEPVISARTMEFHYGKHHQAYVNNLNKLIKGTDYENEDLETIVHHAKDGVFNNAAQVWNHTFYFESFSSTPKEKPEGPLASLIDRDYGSLDNLKADFESAGATLFGSGWVWLVQNLDQKLQMVQTSNADNPIRHGMKPLLVADVWEHAYYLDYQNRRPEYLGAFWKIVDWGVVEGRL